VQIASGINMANQGMSSSRSSDCAGNPFWISQHTIHHGQGVYTNGVQNHGLSGGCGQITLYNSSGNELSHELGHSYGLGHYPGTVFSNPSSDTPIDNFKNSIHHADSGWGYIAHRNRMRGNLLWERKLTDTHSENGVDMRANNFANQYFYGADAMSGGSGSNSLSAFTHYTGYTAIRIQKSLDRYVPDLAFASGYKAWSTADGRYVDATVRQPAFNAPRPLRLGVPIYTLVGGYDPGTTGASATNPSAATSLMYAPLAASYGHTYVLDAPNLTLATRQCWAQVTFAAEPDQLVSMAATRFAATAINNVSINIAQDRNPRSARIVCRTQANNPATEIELTSTVFPAAPPTLNAPLIVGMADGHSALRAKELRAMNAYLESLAPIANPRIKEPEWSQLEGWQDDLTELSTSARSAVDRVRAFQQNVTAIQRYIRQHRPELEANDGNRSAELRALVTASGLAPANGSLFPAASSMRNGNNCVVIDASDPPGLRMEPCTAASAQWWRDARGAFHHLQRAELCITGARANQLLTLQVCDPDLTSQSWTDVAINASAKVRYEPGNYSARQTIDNFGAGPGLYGIHNGGNQQWDAVPVSVFPLLAELSGADVLLLRNLGF
jgi:hypothetical protein